MNKICCRCKIERPIELFVKNKETKDGYNKKCCVCQARYRNPEANEKDVISRRLWKLEKQELEAKGQRRCSKCKEIKSIENDYHGGTSTMCKSYCSKCSCIRTTETISKPENIAKYRAGKRRWRNSDQFRKWAVHSIISHKKRGYDIQIDINSLIDILKLQHNCFYCQYELKVGINASIDIITRKMVISSDNIVICCRSCNSTKATKSKEEYQQLLKLCPDLHVQLQNENENYLKQYYASFIPFQELKRIANGYSNR